LEDVKDDLIGRAAPEPDDGDEIDLTDSPGTWPCLHSSDIQRWLPSDIIEEFGSYYSNMMDSGTLLDPENEQAIVEELTRRGAKCTRDPALVELFDEP
jgi:hypothetical protein